MNLEVLKEKKVLYVEDDSSIVSSFSPILQKVFHSVYIGTNGVEGLSLFKIHNDIDFIISDIKMAKMDGLTMYSEIQKIRSGVPCIMTTAHGEDEYISKAKELGVYDYILKPLDIMKLLTTAIEYFEQKS